MAPSLKNVPRDWRSVVTTERRCRPMHDTFEQTSLWRRTLAGQPDDPYARPRRVLRSVYLQLRRTASELAGEIAISMPMFTDHTIAHIDALWDTAGLVAGSDFPINAAEAFVLGGAFLLHDLGMGLASFPGGLADLEPDPSFADLITSASERLSRADPSAANDLIERVAREQTIAELLRLRHAAQAERLITTAFRTSDGESFYLLEDTVLRQTFGSLIGRIAASHWWSVSDLAALSQPQGSCADHPIEWEVDPLKVACVLRLGAGWRSCWTGWRNSRARRGRNAGWPAGPTWPGPHGAASRQRGCGTGP